MLSKKSIAVFVVILLIAIAVLHFVLPGQYVGGLADRLGYTYTDWTGTFLISYPTSWAIDMETINQAGHLNPGYYFGIENGLEETRQLIGQEGFPSSAFVFKTDDGEASVKVEVVITKPGASLEHSVDNVLNIFRAKQGFHLYNKEWLTTWRDAVLIEYEQANVHTYQILARRSALNWWITASCPAYEWDIYGQDCRNIVESFKRLK